MTWQQRIERMGELMADLGRPVRFMEVCGTHTVAACRSGLRSLLPEGLSLHSGPGCPVCVTSQSFVDKAVQLSLHPDTIVTTFGDMIRVPGTKGSLEYSMALGGSVRIVYSAADALRIAEKNPDKIVVFLGVGFETTVPGIAWSIREGAMNGVSNFRVLCAHKTMPRAMAALLSADDICLDGFLCPGHVSVIIGAGAYQGLVERFATPCVVAGFEPEDMADAIEHLLIQLREGRADVEIQYDRAVRWEPNREAMDIIEEVFETCDADWRGLGIIPGSGLRIRSVFAGHDAEELCDTAKLPEPVASKGCRCGDILRGAMPPQACPLFGKACTPDSPVGPCMVSSEGTCAAYYRYVLGEVPLAGTNGIFRDVDKTEVKPC